MNQSSSWVWKSLLVGAAVGLIVCGGFYVFFKAHQELDVQPAFAWRLGGLSFLLSVIATMIYLRMRAGR